MKTKIILTFIFLTLLLIVSINLIYASLSDVKYPVAELGNCNSQAECEKYCDDSANMEQCLNFAEKNGLMDKDEIEEARKFMPFMKSGDTPGKCKNKKECEAYCDNDVNLNECIEFAKKAGVISQEEYDMVKKTGGVGPGGCKGKKECDAFCEKDENFPTCIDFAKANGLISNEDYEMAKKTGGKGPGGCKRDECNGFCEKDENFNVCIEFAKEHGMINDKDYEMAKKTGGKGPGGCKSKEACDTFCDNPDNQETCTNFAIEHNLMSEGELANMKKNQEFMNSAEGKCKSQCLKEAGLDFKSCGENGEGPEACKTCDEKCFSHDDYGNCLREEDWQQKDQECKNQGEGYHLEDVKGDNGQGGECVVDMRCVYSSGEEWESQAQKDRKLADMQKQWDEERAQYEAENGPGSHQEGSGGCTQPGPEGQCNPGPGGSGGGSSEGGSSSDTSSGGSSESSSSDSGSSSGGDSSASSSGSESSSSGGGGGGESAPATGGVISQGNSNNNLLMKIIKWFFGFKLITKL